MHLSQHAFERSLLVAKAHTHDKLPRSPNRVLGDDPLDPKISHRPLRHIGSTFWYCCPGSCLRTIRRLRSSNFFAGWSAYYSGATDTPYCTICGDTTMEGGWEHTISSCLHPVSIKGMRMDRHTELVRMVRDAILHSKKGNTKVCTPPT